MDIVTKMQSEHGLKSILVVDDESVIRDLCAKALKGYRVLQAGDGEEALRLFERGGIDVILTDVMMPKLNGIELLRRLKEMEPTLVVIVMTGYAEKDIILNALKADADDFITKPLNLLQLKTAVDRALDKKVLKEEIANLKSMDRLKSNFLSLISHKFRTPLTAISLFLQNLACGVYDPDDPESRRNLELIFGQSRYLESLVSELLAFSRFMDAEAGIQPEPCLLQDMIPKLVTSSREAVAKPGIVTSFDLAPLPPISLDREKISFAIGQIIDNAYKFSRESGKITITLRESGDDYLLAVEDTGVGIPRDEMPKIFEKFYQVDPEGTGQIRGFGLGLFYAREFVKLHDGTISIESEPGAGTRITIALPRIAA
ncbi:MULTISPECIES: sensor histidine kinase [Geobacter]|uniref:histidine kinase n=2 Tax=Geobacter TaxID=28231 RepID=A0A0C1U7J9_9BACT|nr:MULTISPECIES: HAMP domain-containing sensor histidine kinase [Geobacter]ANA41439.1 hybrid sensor histidine kinase/response regulator [Geobacter anodireducens]KIE43625.1 histidine kinase [Geobacter soli]MBE2888489.1 HAMP domain-containing histidine kinase [Geobacter anodireducens]HMN01596.1 HAMP domain-containing sensor histidine kinase [Geobacter anodireducens]